jgi:hypothetical protein
VHTFSTLVEAATPNTDGSVNLLHLILSFTNLGIAVEAAKAAAAEGENLGFATREPPQGEEGTTLTISISSTEKKKVLNQKTKNTKNTKCTRLKPNSSIVQKWITDRQDGLPTTYSLDSLSRDLTDTSSSFSSDRRGMLSLFSETHCTLLIQKPPTKLTTHNNKTEARRRRRRRRIHKRLNKFSLEVFVCCWYTFAL